MDYPPPRLAELVLVTPDGKVCGALPPVRVSTPWWQDGAPVIEAVKARFGLDIVLLRLISAEMPAPHGRLVTYLAEISAPFEAASWTGSLDDHPLRAPYARLGGPKAELDWAFAQMVGLASLSQTDRRRCEAGTSPASGAFRRESNTSG